MLRFQPIPPLFLHLLRLEKEFNISIVHQYDLFVSHFYNILQIVIGSTENTRKSKIYEPLLPWLKTGLLTSSGNKILHI